MHNASGEKRSVLHIWLATCGVRGNASHENFMQLWNDASLEILLWHISSCPGSEERSHHFGCYGVTRIQAATLGTRAVSTMNSR